VSIWILTLPFISGFIGWLTNWVAIKMLFHPRDPKRILGMTFQGIFPKRQAAFAEKLGNLVSTELISFEDIKNKLTQPKILGEVENHLDVLLDQYLKVKLKEQMPVLSMFISDDTISGLKTSIKTEFVNNLPSIVEKLAAGVEADLDINKIVRDKVSAFSSDKLEDILNAIMSKEFRFVEIIGAVLGFLIGLVQVAITLLA
jgi:uncharacterized membrane protein YheB (UPF0754 family)